MGEVYLAQDTKLDRKVALKWWTPDIRGLTLEETAEALKVSPRTARREWSMAKAWLVEKSRRGYDFSSG